MERVQRIGESVRQLLNLTLVVVWASCYAQTEQFGEPRRLPNEINSNSEELSPLMSPDGLTLYFVRVLDDRNKGGKVSGMDIWVTHRQASGKWGLATNDTDWNNRDNNAVIGLSGDGKTVYLLNAYKTRNGIAFSKLFNGSWTEPELIPIKGISRNDFIGFYVNPSFDVLLISSRGKNTFGEEDLYVSLKDSLNHWSVPLNLGPTINTSGYEISPFLSGDGRMLFFSSNGHGGLGDADIFMSQRQYGSWDVWSKPRNLGAPVNSQGFDAYFSMYGDSIAYFCSNRSKGLSDIYASTLFKERMQFTITGMDSLIGKVNEGSAKYLTSIQMLDIFGSVNLTSVLFDELTYDLNSANRRVLNEVCLKIRKTADIRVEITSYGDFGLNESENKLLSKWRALNVVNGLLECGIDVSRLNLDVRSSVQPENTRRVTLKFFRLTNP